MPLFQIRCKCILSAAVVASLSCTEAAPDRHPQPSMIPYADQVDFEISKSDPQGELPDDLLKVASRLASARPVLTIGDTSGDGTTFFGLVEDATLDSRGNFLILDSPMNRVSVYAPDGELLEKFGGTGDGPGEFRDPEGIEVTGNDRVIVADRRRRLSFFEYTDTAYRFAGTAQANYTPEEFCLLNGEIIIQAAKPDSTILHRVALDGTDRGSFGRGYLTSNLLLLNQLSDGPVGCSETASTVVTMMKNVPYVYGYRTDGQISWVTRLEDFAPMKIMAYNEDDGTPVVEFSMPEVMDNIAIGIADIPGGYVLVQAMVRNREDIDDGLRYSRLDSYLLSARDGKGMYVGDRLPLVLEATIDHLITSSNEPLPHVTVLEY